MQQIKLQQPKGSSIKGNNCAAIGRSSNDSTVTK